MHNSCDMKITSPKHLLLIVLTFLIGKTSFSNNIFSEDFNAGANNWMLSTVGGGNAWQWYSDQGTDMSGGLRCKYTPDGNYVISSEIALMENVAYTLAFDGKKASSGSARIFKVTLSDLPTIDVGGINIGAATMTSDWVNHSLNFTLNTSGNYHLVIEAEGPSYVFSYLDNIVIEPTIYPTISWLNPTDNATFNQDENILLEVDAQDADGSISAVDYYINGALETTTTAAPFDYSWPMVQPGTYQLYAIAYDNRGNATTSSTQTITVNQASGSADQVLFDFDSQTDFWTYAGGWQLSNSGYNSSTAAFGFNLVEEDFLASPAIQLFTGENYTLDFRVDAQGSGRQMTAAINTQPDLAGATDLLTVDIDSDADYLVLQTVNFNVLTSGAHYLIFYNTSGTGYRKILLDEVKLSGTHNEGALSTIQYDGTTVIAEGADFNFNCAPFDNDGNVVGVDYQANGITVAASDNNPFATTWNDLPVGDFDLTGLVTDNENFANSSFPLSVNVVPENRNASYLGGAGTDDIRGAVIQPDGTVVLAANLSALPSGITPTFLNGANATDQGTILRLNPDGTMVLSATVVATKVVDLANDATGRLYVAAGANGFLRLTPDAAMVDYAKTYGLNVHRVDAGATGYAAILLDDKSDYDDIQLLEAQVRTFDPSGTELSTTGGATTYTVDVCIDEASGTVISIGYKNVFTNDGTGAVLPVDIPAMKGKDYLGNLKFNAYDWDDDDTSPRWLNLPENNMADARGARCAIGQDGLLYAVFEADGGNHCFRYDPFSITTPNPIVGGDAYSEFYNSNTEPKAVIGRFDPGTGQIMKTQQFCARLSNTAANTVRTKNGNIAANAAGEVFLVGRSASGIPINLEHLPGYYQGGAFLLKLSADFSSRDICIRLTNGDARAIALGQQDSYVFAGDTELQLFTNNPIQQNTSGGLDAWFAVEAPTTDCPADYAGSSLSGSSPPLMGFLNVTTDYETNGAISSSQHIGSSNPIQVDYDSAIEITLLPGFTVELGSEFNAFIDGCNGGTGGIID